jgi:hypothetical protein
VLTVDIPRPARHELAEDVCAWCRCLPCVCLREAPCACGGIVYAREGETPEGVRLHQVTPLHVAWRERYGL